MKRVTWCCSWRLKAKTFLEKDPLKSESFCERRERIFQVVVILIRLEFSVGYLVSSRAHGCGPKMRKFCGLHCFFFTGQNVVSHFYTFVFQAILYPPVKESKFIRDAMMK